MYLLNQIFTPFSEAKLGKVSCHVLKHHPSWQTQIKRTLSHTKEKNKKQKKTTKKNE